MTTLATQLLEATPLRLEPHQVHAGGGFWMSPVGSIFDVDTNDARSHTKWARVHQNALPSTLVAGGWIRVAITCLDDSELDRVYWQGRSANRAQLRNLKDIARHLGLSLQRDRRELPDTE